MTGRATSQQADAGLVLPLLERLAPAPPPALVAARIEAHTAAGDVVGDLFGRGGWVARAALARQRRAVSIESSPLMRMLAEIVLRPPDVRHLDAAFQGMAASPRRSSSLKASIADLFATRCATCGRTLVVEEVVWERPGQDEAFVPVVRRYRCTVCRDQRGGSDLRDAALDPEDVRRATADVGGDEARTWARDRFAPVDGAPDLIDDLLRLHTDRQLVALVAMLERIEADLRAAPVLAALRLAFLQALAPTSRLLGATGRPAHLRVTAGRVRVPSGDRYREANPWSAFEEGFRSVRGFVQGLEGGAFGPVQARLGEDLRSLGEGSATAVLALAGPSVLRVDGIVDGRTIAAPRIRLVLGQPPVRPSLDRLGASYHATAWTLGRAASALLPLDALAAPTLRVPWAWQAAAIGRSLVAAAPAIAREGRVVQLVDGGPEAVAAVAVGAASAGYRLVHAGVADAATGEVAVVELAPPGAGVPPPRTRGNQALPAVPGGAGDPDLVPGPGLFAAPERFDRRSFSPTEAARAVTEAAVETLRARGEPAQLDRLFGEVLVGLDRSGQLRRLAAGWRVEDGSDPTSPPRDDAAPDDHTGDGPDRAPSPGSTGSTPSPARPRSIERGEASADAAAAGPAAMRLAPRREPLGEAPATDPVERLLALIREEFERPTQHRLVEIEPGRWWLGDRTDRDAAAPPLADRVEWAVFSLLSTGGRLSEAGFFERMAAMFTGYDLADAPLVRACLESYRSPASTPDRLQTADDLLRRSHDHAELVGVLADAGHRLGMRVAIAEREQGRRDPRTGALLGGLLDDEERAAYLGGISRATTELAEVDCIWYVRGKVAFLWEVEWTAILGESLLRRHPRIGADESLIRFLVVAPERTELLRHKLERSPLLRQAMDAYGWHILKSDHLRTWLAGEHPDLDALEPLLGLDPMVERTGEQLGLFGS